MKQPSAADLQRGYTKHDEGLGVPPKTVDYGFGAMKNHARETVVEPVQGEEKGHARDRYRGGFLKRSGTSDAR